MKQKERIRRLCGVSFGATYDLKRIELRHKIKAKLAKTAKEREAEEREAEGAHACRLFLEQRGDDCRAITGYFTRVGGKKW